MPQNIDFELGPPIEGNLEASHLLEQIESLRGAVRFLRTENGYLKGQDLLKEIQSLPSLGPAPYDMPQTPYVAADGVDELDSDDPLPTSGHVAHTGKSIDAGMGLNREHDERGANAKGEKTSLQALSTESKLLYRELLEYSASPKLIDLDVLERERKQGWTPQRKTAAYQLWERKREGDRLKKQVQGLRLHTARLVRIGG
jgi:dynactin 1